MTKSDIAFIESLIKLTKCGDIQWYDPNGVIMSSSRIYIAKCEIDDIHLTLIYDRGDEYRMSKSIQRVGNDKMQLGIKRGNEVKFLLNHPLLNCLYQLTNKSQSHDLTETITLPTPSKDIDIVACMFEHLYDKSETAFDELTEKDKKSIRDEFYVKAEDV